MPVFLLLMEIKKKKNIIINIHWQHFFHNKNKKKKINF